MSTSRVTPAALPPLVGPTSLRAIYPHAPVDAEILLPVKHGSILRSRSVGRRLRYGGLVALGAILGGMYMMARLPPEIAMTTPFSDDPIVRPLQLDADCSLALRISRRFCEEYQ